MKDFFSNPIDAAKENKKMLQSWIEEIETDRLIGFYLAAYDKDGNIVIFRNETNETRRLIKELREPDRKLIVKK